MEKCGEENSISKGYESKSSGTLATSEEFKSCLKKFVLLSKKYNITFYDKINNKYCIYKKDHIISQIKETIKFLINDHITILKLILSSDETKYFCENNKITQINHKKISKLNKFIDLVHLIYEYKLLNIEALNEPVIDIKLEYNNLVNMSDLVNTNKIKNSKTLKTLKCDEIVIIDSYSW
jgi:hypothetical protein